MENTVLFHLTAPMIVAYIMATVAVFAYGWKKHQEEEASGYKVHKYLRPSWPNLVFNLSAGLIILLALDGLGDVVLSYLREEYPKLSFTSGLHTALAGLSGLLGGPLVGWVIEKGRKRLNDKDPNLPNT